MKDGGLRSIFRDQFRSWHWNTIEVGIIAGGIPDNEFCTPSGIQAWIEFKQTKIYSVQLKPLQVAWHMKRCRYHGNSWIAVRRTPQSIRDAGKDQLWLMWGDQAEALFREGLHGVKAHCWEGGPSEWNRKEVEDILLTLH